MSTTIFQTNFEDNMAIVNGNTTAPSYTLDLADDSDYNTRALITVGDEVPLLEGKGLDLKASADKKFALTGIPDGMGYTKVGDKYYLFVNHELGNTALSKFNNTDAAQIKGARVSLFIFDKDWKAIGGKNLIDQVVDSSGTYKLDTVSGDYKNGDKALSFNRFCSAYLAENGFVGADGKAAPLFFTAEEGGDTSRGWAIGADGTAQALEGLGRYAKENVVSASQYRTGNALKKTVLLSTEDFADGELYMYVGSQTAQDPNGLKNGDLYVLRVKDTDYEGQVTTENKAAAATWTKVDKSAVFGADGKPLADGKALSDFANKGANSTSFQRIEDIAEDPTKPGSFYFTTTGTKKPLGKPEAADVATPELAENPYGRVYRFSLNAQNPTGEIKDFELILKGGPGKGVSYDNILVDKNGKVLLQEDETAFGGDVMKAEQRDGRIVSFDPKTKEVKFLQETDETLRGTLKDEGSGLWETSGIVEVDPNAAPGRSSYLFNVQAHTIKDAKYVEGGQILLTTPTTNESQTKTGSDKADVVIADSKGDFNGNKDVYFSGNGDDTVDLSQVSQPLQSAATAGSNRIYGGNGSDELYAGKNDRLFGEAGDDILDASQGKGGNRLYGGDGNDKLFAGVNDFLYGGEGGDQLFAGKGGSTLYGGGGSDKFYVANGSLPTTTNTISDFELGLDTMIILGVSGTTDFSKLTLTQQGADTLIKAGTNNLAVISGIQSNTLTASNFKFS
jgi:Ca2+-binding RTX toxin-like protein